MLVAHRSRKPLHFRDLYGLSKTKLLECWIQALLHFFSGLKLTICVSIHTSLRWKQKIEVIPRSTIFLSENYAVKLTRLYLTATLKSLVLNIPRPTITSGSARYYMRARAGLWFLLFSNIIFLAIFRWSGVLFVISAFGSQDVRSSLLSVWFFI